MALKTFVAGEVLTASDVNAYLNNVILQVVSVAKTDTFAASASANTWQDVTGLAATITPKSATSKILIWVQLNTGSETGVVSVRSKVQRGTTDIYVGDASGSRTRTSTASVSAATTVSSDVIIYLDSPATTSATTYKVQINANAASVVYVNRARTNTDAAGFDLSASSITLMEISA